MAIGASLLASTVAVAAPIRPEKPPDFSKLKAESIKKWSGAEVLLSGKIVKVTTGPVGLSQPPLRTFKLDIAPDKVLRGTGKFDKQLSVSYSVRQQEPPTFPDNDKVCVIALKFVRDAWILQSVEESSEATIEQATIATSFPIGWTIKDGKLVSPWASIGKPGKAEGAACSVTGRPVLPAGVDVRFSVEPVPPAKKVQFGNPDGDGEYKLVVKNLSDQEVEVPALLTDGKSIRWNESVVIRCQDKTYPIPGSTGSVAGLQPVVLKPGDSVSGTTQIFALDGPPWPKGGYRLEFQFCLGEKSATHSFYYLSRHHDPIREAIQKDLKK
jgi:hypothetical protein